MCQICVCVCVCVCHSEKNTISAEPPIFCFAIVTIVAISKHQEQQCDNSLVSLNEVLDVSLKYIPGIPVSIKLQTALSHIEAWEAWDGGTSCTPSFSDKNHPIPRDCRQADPGQEA